MKKVAPLLKLVLLALATFLALNRKGLDGFQILGSGHSQPGHLFKLLWNNCPTPKLPCNILCH